MLASFPAPADFGHTTSPTPRDRTADPLPDPLDHDAVVRLAAKNKTDSSKANGSSIAFIVEYDDKRVLFGADAHPQPLVDALDAPRPTGERRVRIDLFKLSHHGSNANVSTELIEVIDTGWLISTNGDNFAHPDDAAIAKVITTSDGPVTFFCNYASDAPRRGSRGPLRSGRR